MGKVANATFVNPRNQQKCTFQDPSKPFLSILKFEQLYIAKHVQMFSNLVNMLKCSNYSSRPSGTSWRTSYLDQSARKPFLSRTKFERAFHQFGAYLGKVANATFVNPRNQQKWTFQDLVMSSMSHMTCWMVLPSLMSWRIV